MDWLPFSIVGFGVVGLGSLWCGKLIGCVYHHSFEWADSHLTVFIDGRVLG